MFCKYAPDVYIENQRDLSSHNGGIWNILLPHRRVRVKIDPQGEYLSIHCNQQNHKVSSILSPVFIDTLYNTLLYNAL